MAEAEQNNGWRKALLVPWVGLTALSTVALTAHVVDNGAGGSSTTAWVTSVTAISMSFALFACVAYFAIPDHFVGQHAEAGLAFLIILFWAGGLPVIMKPANELAVGTDTAITNANLYFSSWGAFLANFYLLSETGKSYNVDITKTPPKIAKWAMIAVISLIVMISCSRFYKSSGYCGSGDQVVSDSTCRRTAYGISLGVIGAIFAAVMAAAVQREIVGLSIEVGVSAFLLVMYVFGIGFITFGTGPGTPLGNIYFFTWGGFVLAAALWASCAKLFIESRNELSADTGGSTTAAAAPKTEVTSSPAVPAEEDI